MTSSIDLDLRDFGSFGSKPVVRDSSAPDRARIDSDVRAFLRPASSPWIVFDRDSRVDDFAKSAMRVGAMFASRPSYRPDSLEQTGKPMDEAALARRSRMNTPVVITEVNAEPSNVVVARDLLGEPASDEPAPVVHRSRWPLAFGAVAGALAAVGLLVAVTSAHEKATAGAKGTGPAHVAAVVAPAAAPTQEASPLPPVPAPIPEMKAAPEPAKAAVVDPKKKFGKLTLKGDATRKSVWFDGKRMLGTGQRTFMVMCGMHTIAVAEKGDTKDVEIPCNGEYTVGK